MTRSFLTTIRWMFVFPGAVAICIISFNLAKVVEQLATFAGILGGLDANVFNGFTSHAFNLIFTASISGFAFVAAGAEIAPTKRRSVAIILAALPTFYSTVQIVAFVMNSFVHFGKINIATIFENFFLASGAVLAALKVYQTGASPIAQLLPEAWTAKTHSHNTETHLDTSKAPDEADVLEDYDWDAARNDE